MEYSLFGKVENIKEARKLKNDTYTQVKGFVTVEPGVVANQYFYIEDSTAGIQIYSYYKFFPDLHLGDEIIVYGQLSGTYYRRIKIKDPNWIHIISINNKNPPVQEFTSNQINYDNEGKLIKFIGRVVKLSGQTFYLEDDLGQIRIVIRDTAGFKRQKMKRGDITSIIGIIYCSKSGCSLLPRYQNDIRIIFSSTKSKKASKTTAISTILSTDLSNDNPYSGVANFLLSNVLHNNFNLKEKINLSKRLIIIDYYIILTTTVLCILFMIDILWKKNLLQTEQRKLAN